MKLRIYKETPARLPRSRLVRLFEKIIEGEGDPGWTATVNLIVTDNKRIRRLNRRHRSMDRPTDVLSFNIDPPQQADGIFGEIYISATCVRRQLDSFERGLFHEYLMLFCHGLLHLLGYDHESDQDETTMNERQQHYLHFVARENG